MRAQPKAVARQGAENSKSFGQRLSALVPRGRLPKMAEALRIFDTDSHPTPNVDMTSRIFGSDAHEIYLALLEERRAYDTNARNLAQNHQNATCFNGTLTA